MDKKLKRNNPVFINVGLIFLSSILSIITLKNAISAEFFVLPETKSLLLMGEIFPSDVKEVRKFQFEEGIDTLILRGPGGSLEAAISIAQIVRFRDLDTVIAAKSECASACALIFGAGSKRYMQEGSKVGFHLPYTSIEEKDIEEYCRSTVLSALGAEYGEIGSPGWRERAELRESINPNIMSICFLMTYQMGFRDLFEITKIFRDRGIDDAVFKAMIDTPSSAMQWYTPDQARAVGLVTSD